MHRSVGSASALSRQASSASAEPTDRLATSNYSLYYSDYYWIIRGAFPRRGRSIEDPATALRVPIPPARRVMRRCQYLELFSDSRMHSLFYWACMSLSTDLLWIARVG